MARILALDSAVGACTVGVVVEGRVIARQQEILRQGQAARLPMMVQHILLGHGPIDLVAVTVGPGSFTGIRGCLALAHGLAAAWGCPIVGVRVTEALAEDAPGGDGVWIAIQSRAGRVFLARDGAIGSYALDALPAVPGRPVLLGNAAQAVAERLGDRFVRSDLVFPGPVAIASIGLQRQNGELAPLAAQPLYVDEPEALRPGPA